MCVYISLIPERTKKKEDELWAKLYVQMAVVVQACPHILRPKANLYAIGIYFLLKKEYTAVEMDSHYFFHGNIDVHVIASSLPVQRCPQKKAIIFYSILRPLSIGSNGAGNKWKTDACTRILHHCLKSPQCARKCQNSFEAQILEFQQFLLNFSCWSFENLVHTIFFLEQPTLSVKVVG